MGLNVLLRASPRDPIVSIKEPHMGRVKPPEERRRYTVRLMASELKAISENADVAGVTVSEYIRRCALKKRIRSRVGAYIVGNLSRLGGLQKHLLMQIKDSPHEAELRGQLNATLNELHTTLRALIRAYAHRE
jgi:hypothetical protein